MVNLIEKYADKIQAAFTLESLLAGKLSDDYEFKGAKTVKMLIPQTVPMNDYKRFGANRYGNPDEMQDIVQEMTLTQDKSFSLTIDKGNNLEQGSLKNAGKMLALQIKERAVPLSDTYGFERLSALAGKIVGNSTALTKSNICDRISEATQSLDDDEIPQDDRTLFINAEGYKLLKHSTEFLSVESMAKDALSKGVVGRYDNMDVVKVPKSRWPKNVNFIVVQKNCAAFPVTLSEGKFHKDPPGLSGDLLEGRQIYDLFVFSAKANGVYVEVNTASGNGVIVSTPVIASNGAITCETDSAIVVFTTDGSDPRYSATAKIGTDASSYAENGDIIKAYAYKDGCFNSCVAAITYSEA